MRILVTLIIILNMLIICTHNCKAFTCGQGLFSWIEQQDVYRDEIVFINEFDPSTNQLVPKPTTIPVKVGTKDVNMEKLGSLYCTTDSSNKMSAIYEVRLYYNGKLSKYYKSIPAKELNFKKNIFFIKEEIDKPVYGALFDNRGNNIYIFNFQKSNYLKNFNEQNNVGTKSKKKLEGRFEYKKESSYVLEGYGEESIFLPIKQFFK